jgi:rsbT antagonist protein RsbS
MLVSYEARMDKTETPHPGQLRQQPVSTTADTPRVAIQISHDIVVASIQMDLDEEVLARFREDLLRRIHETGSRGVILDVSGLEILDSEEFSALRDIIKMSRIMGAESVLVGLQPGVVSSLIQAGVEVEGLRSTIDLDAAHALLGSLLDPEPTLTPAPDPDDEADAGVEHQLSLETDRARGDQP